MGLMIGSLLVTIGFHVLHEYECAVLFRFVRAARGPVGRDEEPVPAAGMQRAIAKQVEAECDRRTSVISHDTTQIKAIGTCFENAPLFLR